MNSIESVMVHIEKCFVNTAQDEFQDLFISCCNKTFKRAYPQDWESKSTGNRNQYLTINILE